MSGDNAPRPWPFAASGRAWLAANGHPLLATFAWDRAQWGFPRGTWRELVLAHEP